MEATKREKPDDQKFLLALKERPELYEWLIGKMLEGMTFHDVLALMRESPQNIREKWPERFRYGAALAEYLQEHDDHRDEAFASFLLQLRAELEHGGYSAFEKILGKAMLARTTQGACHTCLENIRLANESAEDHARISLHAELSAYDAEHPRQIEIADRGRAH